MSDVPLTKKMFFETEDAWGIPYTRFDVMKIKDVVDALRKFQDRLELTLKIAIENDDFQVANITKLTIQKYEEIFGVLDSQNKGCDSP